MTETDYLLFDHIVSVLTKLIEHTTITNHIPGKIRLKVSLSAIKILKSIDVDEMIRYFPGLLDYQFKPLKRTVDIEYDHEQMPYDIWESMEQSKKQPELKTKLKEQLRLLWNNKEKE